MYFCREGRSVFFRMERAAYVSIDCYNPVRSWHLELEVCIVWYRIESSECGSSEQGMIAVAERDDIKYQIFASEIIRGSEDHLQCD